MDKSKWPQASRGATPIGKVDRQKQFRLAMALADEIGMDDDGRHELAKMIPGVDEYGEGTWKTLTTEQLHVMINMMEGYQRIHFLLSM